MAGLLFERDGRGWIAGKNIFNFYLLIFNLFGGNP